MCQRQGRERAENTNDPTGIEILDLRCPKNTHNINSPVVCCTRFIAIAPVGPPVSKKSPFPVTVHSIRLLAQHCRVLIVSGPLRKATERLYWRRAFFNSSSIRILEYLLQPFFLGHQKKVPTFLPVGSTKNSLPGKPCVDVFVVFGPEFKGGFHMSAHIACLMQSWFWR